MTTETCDKRELLEYVFNAYGMRYESDTGRVLANRLHTIGGIFFYFNEDTLAELKKPDGKPNSLELIVNDPQLIRLFEEIVPKLKQLTDYEVGVSK